MAEDKEFLSTEDLEALARKHIEAYTFECNLKTFEDADHASQIMAKVALDCMEVIHNGTATKLSIH